MLAKNKEERPVAELQVHISDSLSPNLFRLSAFACVAQAHLDACQK
jgi:hypothetical protein